MSDGPSTTAPSGLPRLHIIMLGLRGCPDVQGGVEKHVEQMAPVLAEFGCDVEVIVRTAYCARSAPGVWRNVRFHRIWAPRSRSLEAIVHTALGVGYAAWRRPDILHIHAIGPALLAPAARLLGLRVMVTHHGADYERAKWGAAARAVLKLGERAGMTFAHGRIAVSRAIAATVEQKYGTPAFAIPNGVSVPPMPHSADLLQPFGLKPQRYVLTVGRLVPEKRHLDVIAAFEKAALPGWKLAIVGGADHPDAYSSAVNELAAQTPGVVMTGFQNGEPLAQLFAHAGAFVLPSSHEGLPIALLEALSYGVPTLASDIPANREVQLPAGSYFPVADIDALAAGLRSVAQALPSGQEREAQRARIARDYDYREIAQRTLAAYRQTLDGSGPRPVTQLTRVERNG
jgi:glycosyltransferase involved in cell wall biosynthesis